MNKLTGNLKTVWNKLLGDAAEFSMENRAFNYVCVITFPILLFAGFFDLFISQTFMTVVIGFLFLALCFVYYYSRYKRRYHAGVIAYAILSYFTLILNYFTNDGIIGPTVTLFFLTFHLLIAIGRRRFFSVWIILHLSIVTLLLYGEYIHPAWVPHNYNSKLEWFWDIGSNFVIAIAFIFGITSYLRGSFHKERALARERLQAITAQNEQIKAQNIQLEKLNDEKNKLLSIISHDLKSPLDSIRGYLSLMSENLLEGDEKEKVETDLLERTKYTSDLLQNLLSWGRTQIHGVSVNLVPVHLNGLLEETAGNKLAPASRKGIKLTYAIEPGVKVVGDRDMLHIVLRNLVNNAIKFTPTGGEVAIKVLKKHDKAEIAVADNGIGIPAEKHAELFTLKTRSTYGTDNEKGTGLGLMMCREYMTYQNGDIWFESEVGKGSVFYISLPLIES